ncbi:STAS domain-containing protein [Kitasatospora sp. MBT63]|uniref:STAS domain-containing protein n=1 Tax=Kitasatospora sp. MBT63 TaxID=1444768 RepID=UPI000689F225|nr:STAS domain-containing protein [Kitasatospora sp. MBT63]
MEDGLRITCHQGDHGVRIVRLDGAADMDTAGVLRAALDEELGSSRAPEALVVDCRRLDFCASAGLNEFLRARQLAVRCGATFRLAAPQAQLVRLLRVTEVDTVLEVVPAVGCAPS